jgi:hypothetical protein
MGKCKSDAEMGITEAKIKFALLGVYYDLTTLLSGKPHKAQKFVIML